MGKDVAGALGYSDVNKAVAMHVGTEDKKLNDKSSLSFGQRGATIINESGLYSLILGSQLPSAKKFKRWVTSEVLPIIRKTGGYVSNDELFISTYLPFAEDTTKLLFRTTLSTVRSQNEIIKNQQKEIEYKENVIIGLVDDISLAEKRQILNRVVRYKNANYRERWNLLYREFENKYHINLSHRFDTYNENHKPKCKSKVDYVDKIMNKIPELYEIAVKLYENDIKALVQEMYQYV